MKLPAIEVTDCQDKASLQLRIDVAWKSTRVGVDWLALERVVLGILESNYVPVSDKPAMIAEAYAAFTKRGMVQING